MQRYVRIPSVAVAFIAFMMCGSAAIAQTVVPSPTPANLKLEWEHPGTNVDKFLLCVDAAPCVDVGLPALAGVTPITAGLTVYGVPVPAMTPGQHSLVLRTSFSGAEQPSVPFAAMLVLVEAPTNLRTVKGS